MHDGIDHMAPPPPPCPLPCMPPTAHAPYHACPLPCMTPHTYAPMHAPHHACPPGSMHAPSPGRMHNPPGKHACPPESIHVPPEAFTPSQEACMPPRSMHTWEAPPRGMHGCGGVMCGCGGHVWLWGGMRGCSGACMGYDEIQSMSGRYASYWNAYLLSLFLSLVLMGPGKICKQCW